MCYNSNSIMHPVTLFTINRYYVTVITLISVYLLDLDFLPLTNNIFNVT